MADLDAFYGAMKPFLSGEVGPSTTRRALGLDPQDAAGLEFYRTLVERNLFKVLRELFPSVRALVLREADGAWARLGHAYARAHPPRHRDPNRFGEAFPTWLSEQADVGPLSAGFLEEMADYCWIRHLAHTAPETSPGDDGFDRRLFVRQYGHPIPAFTAALEADPGAALPSPCPEVVLVYRALATDLQDLQRAATAPRLRPAQEDLDGTVGWFKPSARGLAVLARRQGLPLPSGWSFAPAELDRAERELARRGVLWHRPR